MKPLLIIAAATLIAGSGYVFSASAENPIAILLAAGDIAECKTAEHRKRAEATAKLALKKVKEAEGKSIPVKVLALGDLAYEFGTLKDFRCFDGTWGKRLSSYLLPVPGNHEYHHYSDPDYYRYFKTERPNSLVFQQGEKKGYYSFDFPSEKEGPWRLIGLNSELQDTPMQTQIDWLNARLQEKSNNGQKPRCVLAFWHRPVLSSGNHGHGDCKKVAGLKCIENKPCRCKDARLCRPDDSVPNCNETKVMLLAYQALYKQGASAHTPDAKVDKQRGLRSFVVGTGGASLYRLPYTKRWGIPPEDLGEVYDHTAHGLLRLELYPDSYRWSFISTNDEKELPLKGRDGVVVDNASCNLRP